MITQDRERKPPRIDQGPKDNEDVLGETEPTARGYFMRISLVYFDQNAGVRLRLAQLQVRDGETYFLRHLDMVPHLALRTIAVLDEAAVRNEIADAMSTRETVP